MSRAIAVVLRDAALGPSLGTLLSDWLPPEADNSAAFIFAYSNMPAAYMFHFLDDADRRMFLLFCSLMAEDEE